MGELEVCELYFILSKIVCYGFPSVERDLGNGVDFPNYLRCRGGFLCMLPPPTLRLAEADREFFAQRSSYNEARLLHVIYKLF